MPPPVRRTPAQPSDLDQIVAETAARVADSTIAALRSMFSESFIRGVIEREAKIAVQAALLAQADRIQVAPSDAAPISLPAPRNVAVLAYRPREAAEAIGISEALVYELISDGTLIARKVGRATIILRSDIDTYLASLPLTASAAKVVTGARP